MKENGLLITDPEIPASHLVGLRLVHKEAVYSTTRLHKLVTELRGIRVGAATRENAE